MAFRRRARRFVRRRRPFRRSFRRGSRLTRIRRRVLARRPHRPEIKYAVVQSDARAIASGASYSTRLSPTNIPVGPGNGQRIGNEIMFRKIYARFFLRDNSGNTPVTAPVRQSYTVRMVIWAPRTDQDDATSYMAALGPVQVPDYNIVTTMFDRYFTFSPPYIDLTIGTGPLAAAGGSAPYERYFNKAFFFPRKVHFNSIGTRPDYVDGEKYACWVSLYATSGPVQFGFQSNTYYTDS